MVQNYTHSATVDFYETCPDCLLMIFRGSRGRYLLNYSKHKTLYEHTDVGAFMVKSVSY